MSRTENRSFGSLLGYGLAKIQLLQKLANRAANAPAILHAGNARTVDTKLFGQLILRPTVLFPEQSDVDILLHAA